MKPRERKRLVPRVLSVRDVDLSAENKIYQVRTVYERERERCVRHYLSEMCIHIDTVHHENSPHDVSESPRRRLSERLRAMFA